MNFNLVRLKVLRTKKIEINTEIKAIEFELKCYNELMNEHEKNYLSAQIKKLKKTKKTINAEIQKILTKENENENN